MHPNLYADGKVCLSILGTWGTKEWSPLLTFEKVLYTIQGLLDNNPVLHEPGQRRNNTYEESYRATARYWGLKAGVVDVLKRTDLNPEIMDIMKNYFQKNIDKYIQSAEKLRPYDNRTVQSFHSTVHINVDKLITEIKHLFKI